MMRLDARRICVTIICMAKLRMIRPDEQFIFLLLLYAISLCLKASFQELMNTLSRLKISPGRY